MNLFTFQCAWLASTIFTALAFGRPVVIHEWGTFTSLQDESGNAIGGINVDTEPLPGFVHNFAPAILPNAPKGSGKGLPTAQSRVDITMRLETPIVYFHLPPDAGGPLELDLKVRFQGGWLTQFYPNAEAQIDGTPIGQQPRGPLRGATVGSLTWNHLKVGLDSPAPKTQAHVWLAPRQVRSDPVTAHNGEGEQYLFYRGVGHLDAPLRIAQPAPGELAIQTQVDARVGPAKLEFSHLWLVDVQANRSLAFRHITSINADGSEKHPPTRVSSGFAAADHQPSNLTALRSELRTALIQDGLFEDEAEALLNTWGTSYFQEPGLRVFFLVPRAWTDAYLPLEVSRAAHIQRTMVGRIEIVTAGQRTVLRQLATVPTNLPSADFLKKCESLAWQLGRFRSALILDEQRRQPSESLARYIRSARLQGDLTTPQGQASAQK